MGRPIDLSVLELGQKPIRAAQVAIAFMVMSDRPEKLDAVVIHGLSSGMYQAGNLFDHIVKMSDNYKCSILVVGGDGRATGGLISKVAWIGSEAIVSELTSRDVDCERIIVMDPITHSKEEALAIVITAKKHGFRTVGSVSVAYHGGRMFPYIVAAMKEVGYWIDYRILPPPATDWWMEILGSQGAKNTTCLESAMADAIKIEGHITKGFAAPFEEVFYFFKNRSEIVKNQRWDFPGQ